MQIHRLQGFAAYSYLIETADALFLVDAGSSSHAHTILEKVEALGRSPRDIALAVVTHGHADHFGGLAEVQSAGGGFPVLAHPSHVSAVSRGAVLISPGLNPFSKVYELLAKSYLSAFPLRGVREVVPVPDGLRLDEFGLAGTVLYTPGHSSGDIALVLDDGTAFVGDTVQGRRIPGLTPPELPNMALDVHQVLDSWAKLLDAGATSIMPAHGAIVTAEEVRPVLERLRARRGYDAYDEPHAGAV